MGEGLYFQKLSIAQILYPIQKQDVLWTSSFFTILCETGWWRL